MMFSEFETMTQDNSFQEAAPSPFDPDDTPVVPIMKGRLPSYIANHRARLRNRFMEGGAAAMPDYELLELLLFRSIPRIDV